MKRLAAALLLVALGRLASPGAVPVYDGVDNPDEPYLYAGTGKPPAASVTATAVAGAPLQLKTAESGPQLQVALPPDALTPGTSVTAEARPGKGETAPQGVVDGNVYRIALGGTLQQAGHVLLRAAVMTRPDPVVVRRAGAADPWTALPTTRVGRDVLSADLTGPGDYAVVIRPGSTPLSDVNRLSTGRLALLVSGVLLLVVLTVLVLRRPQEGDPSVS